MANYPKRSNKTELNHDILLLFDFMALTGDPYLKHLHQEKYDIHLNVSYTHNIKNEQLESVMESLIAKHWINSYLDKEGTIRYNLTKSGSELWEIERMPIWEKYCVNQGDDGCFQAICTQKEVGMEFAQVALSSHLYSFELDEMELIELEPDYLFKWKKLDKIWMYKAPEKEQDLSVDWELYESKRTWWSTLEELQKFL